MSEHISTPSTGSWLRTLLSGQPHQIIHSEHGVYLHRTFLVPRNSWHNIYLHRFVGSDDPPALHSHPWAFATLILRGSYTEITAGGTQWRGPGSVAFRRAGHRHRVQLHRDRQGREQPCVSIVITGRRSHQWGFFCPRRDGTWRFIPWQNFGAGGCGEYGNPSDARRIDTEHLSDKRI